MMNPQQMLKVLNRIETAGDKTWFAIKRRFNRIDPIMILPYRGYGNQQQVFISGRVLEIAKLDDPTPEDTLWQNFRAMLRRYSSKEIPFVRLSATFQQQTSIIATDDDGYFQVSFPVDLALLSPEQVWHPVHFELLEQIVPGQEKVTAVGEVVIPDSKSDFGIISDIDDTVLVSHTTQLLKVIKLSLAGNATTRMPFHGVTAFYEAWQKGGTGQAHNPFFYVSSSPLKRMGLEYVDIFYHHRPDPDTPLEETMRTLDLFVGQGKALYVGLSNYQPEEASRAIRILNDLGTPCLIHQPKYSMFERWVENGLLDLLEQQGVGCIPFSPLAQGMLTNKYLNGIPEDSRAAKSDGFLQKDDLTDDKLNKIRQLNGVAESRGQSLAQMALAWLLKDPRITSVLIGASKPEQLADSLKCLNNKDFSQEELTHIENILQ